MKSSLEKINSVQINYFAQTELITFNKEIFFVLNLFL